MSQQQKKAKYDPHTCGACGEQLNAGDVQAVRKGGM